jgi:hypothetical protein
MSEPIDPTAAAHEFAKGLAVFREIVAPIDETVLGYRRQLEAAGWSPTAAEQMALSLHGVLMAQLVAGLTSPQIGEQPS